MKVHILSSKILQDEHNMTRKQKEHEVIDTVMMSTRYK